MTILYLALAVLAGSGIGFVLGIQYILHLQRVGTILPINPFALPMTGQGEKDTPLRTILTPAGTKVKKIMIEEGSINVFKNPKNKDEDKPYI